MFKEVLVPVDVGNLDNADNSLKLAARMCAEGGRITILHVVEHLPEFVSAELPKDFAKNSAEAAHKALKKIMDDASVKASIQVEEGHASATILHVAEKSKSDLIIIASHKPEMMDLLLGSTAARVVRKAKCSVLVTR